MFSGRIAFIALQHGLGLAGAVRPAIENDDLRAAAQAAAAGPAPREAATPEHARPLLLSLLAALF